MKAKAYFCNNEEVSPPPSGENLTAQQKVALAKKRAGTRWGAATSTNKPTSRRQLRCEEGEGPRTREFQLVWWPDVFPVSNFGHL